MNKLDLNWDYEEFNSEIYPKSDYWIIEYADYIFFTKKIYKKNKKYSDIYYAILERTFGGNISFSFNAFVNYNSAMRITKKDVNLILNDKIDICYMGKLNMIKPITLSNICNLLEINKESVNFLI